MSAKLHAGMLSAKKVVFSSPGLVDFVVGLAYFVFPLPNRLVKFHGNIFEETKHTEVLLVRD